MCTMSRKGTAFCTKSHPRIHSVVKRCAKSHRTRPVSCFVDYFLYFPTCMRTSLLDAFVNRISSPSCSLTPSQLCILQANVIFDFIPISTERLQYTSCRQDLAWILTTIQFRQQSASWKTVGYTRLVSYRKQFFSDSSKLFSRQKLFLIVLSFVQLRMYITYRPSSPRPPIPSPAATRSPSTSAWRTPDRDSTTVSIRTAIRRATSRPTPSVAVRTCRRTTQRRDRASTRPKRWRVLKFEIQNEWNGLFASRWLAICITRPATRSVYDIRPFWGPIMFSWRERKPPFCSK